MPAAGELGQEPEALAALLSLGLEESIENAERAKVAAEPAGLPEVGRKFGAFELQAEIGRGGMGIIYQAEERATGRILALKMIAGPLAGYEEVQRRFEREVRAAATLDHPHILPIYEVGECQGIPFYSMKLARGGSLAVPRNEREWSPREAAELALKIARAVQHAHARGVLHRDLKPANVLLDEAGEPMLADFGLAQLLLDAHGGDLTQTLVVLGTPGYVAPELMEGISSPASDIYGIGAILYRLLTGRSPFEGREGASAFRLAAKSAPTLATKLRPDAPRGLAAICDRCLQPIPADRYASAEDLARDVERWLERGRVQMAPRRRRQMAKLTLSAFVVIAFLAGALYWAGDHAKISAPPPPTLAPEAEYFLGRARDTIAREHSEEALRNAEQLLRRAVAVAPNAGPAHAELSRILSRIYWHIDTDEQIAAEALAEARKALELEPQSGWSHLAMGDYLFRCRRDYEAALAHLETAARLAPQQAVVYALSAIVLKRLGRWEDALAANRKATEVAPESAAMFYDLATTCDAMRLYPEALQAIERAIYLAPDNRGHVLLRGWVRFRGTGDLSELKRLTRELPFEQQMSPQYFDTVFWLQLWTGDYPSALRLAESIPPSYAVRRSEALLLKPYFIALAKKKLGDEEGAREAFEEARDQLEARVLARPSEARTHAQLGIVYSHLGRAEEAVRAAERATELLPMTRDPLGGSYLATQLAETYARAGRHEEAIALIGELLEKPGHLTRPELRIDPRWRSLQDDPRFERLKQGSAAGLTQMQNPR